MATRGRKQTGIRKMVDLISNEEFFNVWNNAETLARAAMGFPTLVSFDLDEQKQHVSMRACSMRKIGFQINGNTLKVFPRGRQKGWTPKEMTSKPETPVVAPGGRSYFKSPQEPTTADIMNEDDNDKPTLSEALESATADQTEDVGGMLPAEEFEADDDEEQEEANEEED